MPRPPPGYFEQKYGPSPPPPSPPPATNSYPEFHDDPAVRLQRIREYVSLLPEGRELLKFADENHIRITIEESEKMNGNLGTAQWDLVKLNKSSSDIQLTITALHELRHIQQSEFFRETHVARPIAFLDPRTAAFQLRLMEGDAVTFETMMALKLKKMGRPEFYDQMDGETATMKEFLAKNPPESFKDEQALARGIFTEIQLHGLRGYDKKYFEELRQSFKNHPDVKDAGPLKFAVNTTLPLTSLGNSEIGKLYGAELMSDTSLNALRTGIQQTYSPFDRKTLKLIEQLPPETETMTQQEYTEKSNYIQARIKYRNLTPALRDSSLTQQFGEALHKNSGKQLTYGMEKAPRTGLLEKGPVMLETPAITTPVSDSKFAVPETIAAKPGSGFKGGGIAAGVVMATASGIAAAATPDATPGKIADAAVNTVIPGWTSAQKGDLCAAFGEVAGVTASGVAMVATTAVVVPAAVTVTAASGPAAPLVAPLAAIGATATVAGAGAATYSAVAPGAEQLCKTTVNFAKFIGSFKI